MVKAKRVGKRALSLFLAVLMTASIFSGVGDVFGLSDMFSFQPTEVEAASVGKSYLGTHNLNKPGDTYLESLRGGEFRDKLTTFDYSPGLGTHGSPLGVPDPDWDTKYNLNASRYLYDWREYDLDHSNISIASYTNDVEHYISGFSGPWKYMPVEEAKELIEPNLVLDEDESGINSDPLWNNADIEIDYKNFPEMPSSFGTNSTGNLTVYSHNGYDVYSVRTLTDTEKYTRVATSDSTMWNDDLGIYNNVLYINKAKKYVSLGSQGRLTLIASNVKNNIFSYTNTDNSSYVSSGSISAEYPLFDVKHTIGQLYNGSPNGKPDGNTLLLNVPWFVTRANALYVDGKFATIVYKNGAYDKEDPSKKYDVWFELSDLIYSPIEKNIAKYDHVQANLFYTWHWNTSDPDPTSNHGIFKDATSPIIASLSGAASDYEVNISIHRSSDKPVKDSSSITTSGSEFDNRYFNFATLEIDVQSGYANHGKSAITSYVYNMQDEDAEKWSNGLFHARNGSDYWGLERNTAYFYWSPWAINEKALPGYSAEYAESLAFTNFNGFNSPIYTGVAQNLTEHIETVAGFDLPKSGDIQKQWDSEKFIKDYIEFNTKDGKDGVEVWNSRIDSRIVGYYYEQKIKNNGQKISGVFKGYGSPTEDALNIKARILPRKAANWGLDWGNGVRTTGKASGMNIRYAASQAGTVLMNPYDKVLVKSLVDEGTGYGHIYYTALDNVPLSNKEVVDGNTAKFAYKEKVFNLKQSPSYIIEAEPNCEITHIIFNGNDITYMSSDKKTANLSDFLKKLSSNHEILVGFKTTNPTPTPGPTSTPTPVDPIDSGSLYNVTWDYNYEGAGVTSELHGFKAISVLDNAYGEITDGNGTVSSTQRVVYPVAIPWTVPKDPERPGYTFVGWSTNSEAKPGQSGIYDHNTMSQPDTSEGVITDNGVTTYTKGMYSSGNHETYFAIWQPDTVTINWNGNGGWSGTTSQEYGSIIESNNHTMSRLGYAFTGWYLDKDCTLPLSADTVLEGNILSGNGTTHTLNVYAGWEADEVEVTYIDTRTGRQDTTVQHYKYDDILHILADVGSHDGWNFNYWDGPAADGVRLNSSNLTQVPLSPTDKDGIGVHNNRWTMTFNAVWTQKTIGYLVAVNTDDWDNNDGARPNSVDVALISSETGAQVDKTTINLTPSNKNLFEYVFRGKKVTINDTTTEPIVYTAQMTGYTDVQGNHFSIEDPHSTNGTIAVAAIESASTQTPTAYQYAINNGTSQYSTSIALSHDKILTEEDIKFTIRWEDNSDEAGKRPNSLRLQLYANGKPVTDNGNVVINSSMCDVSEDGNSWSYVFKDFEKYADGKLVNYEVAVINDNNVGTYNKNGYTVNYFTNGSINKDKVGATLSRKKETVNPTVTIDWQDGSNRDGQRPERVTVALTAKKWNRTTESYDYETVDEYEFIDDVRSDVWTHTWNNLDKYAGGKEIIYSATVTGDVEDWNYSDAPSYTITSSNITNTDAKITISKLSELTDVSGIIEWKDGANVDNLRPSEVRVSLYADGVPVEGRLDTSVVSMGGSTDSHWAVSFRDLPKYREGSEGEEIVYSIRVEEMEDKFISNGNYTASYLTEYGNVTEDPNQSGEMYICFSHGQEVGDYTLTITWDDNSNRDGYRPSALRAEIDAYYWNSATNSWDTKYVTGYTFNTQNGYEAWSDEWSYTFRNLYVNYDGQPIIYKARIVSDLNSQIDAEIGQKEYSWTASNLDVTISKKIDRKDLTAKIEWDDNHNQDNIRPTSVIAKLYADGTPVKGLDAEQLLNKADDSDEWEVTFKNLPVYRQDREGVEIVYAIEVIEVPDNPLYGTYNVSNNGEEETMVRYTAVYRGLNADGSMVETSAISESRYPYVKLTHGTEQGTMRVYATWHDEENQDGMRPTQVLVDLYKQVGDSEQVYLKTVTVTAGADDSWVYVFENLPVFQDGKQILYIAKISDDSKNTLRGQGYDVSMEVNNIHLYHTPLTGTVNGTVDWSDNEDNDNIRPDAVKATLFKNGVSTGETVELSESNGWSAYWYQQPTYQIKDGIPGVENIYSMEVETPEGYVVEYTPETITTTEKDKDSYIVARMSHVNQTGEVPVTVEWNDNSDNAGVRPDSIHAQLYANGVAIPGKRIEITGEGNIWTTKVLDMPMYSEGKPIYYSAMLDDNLESIGYTKLSAGTTIYLSREPVTASMYVSFRFDDNRNADGKRPDGVYGTLTADGVPVNDSKYKHTFYYDADGHVNQYFTGLPVYSANGKYIKYNINIEFDEMFGGSPEEYMLSTSRDITLDPNNNNANQVVVTLKKSADTRTVNGDILWFDANNQRNHRPDTLDINLYNNVTSDYTIYTLDSVSGHVIDRDGNVVGEVSVAEWGNNGASRWSYTISGLRKSSIFENGESRLISYSIKVDSTEIAPFYPTVHDGTNMNASLISSTYSEDTESSYQDYTVNINWLDNTNNWGYRPNDKGLTLTLYANGEKYRVETLNVQNASTENIWTTTFTKLPTMLNGVPVVWTVDINDVNTYTKNVNLLDFDKAVIEMTQSIGFKFDLNWVDEKNDDAVRPENVELDIYADGSKVDSITLTGDSTADTWNGVIHDLPVWNATDATLPIKYTFVWKDSTTSYLIENRYHAVDKEGVEISEENPFYSISATEWGVNTPDAGYDLASGTYSWSATLKRDRNLVSSPITITVDDDNNRDGVRPETVMVQLYADGTPYGEPVEINISDLNEPMFSYTWVNLPEKSAGKDIVYTAGIVSSVAPYSKTIDESGHNIKLFYSPEIVSVNTTVVWDDSSEVHIKYNSLGTEIGRLYGIEHKDVYVQLMADGVDFGEPMFLKADTYGSEKTIEWPELLRYKDKGTEIKYSFRIFSEDLDTLLNDKGYELVYSSEDDYNHTATISHEKFAVSGTVWQIFGELGDKELAPGAKVTVYKYDPETNISTSVGHTTADENGNFVIEGVPEGILTVKATITDANGVNRTGETPVVLDRGDVSVEVLINRLDAGDNPNYRYYAQGNAAYQTDKTDPNTIHSVPEGSIVLLYKLVDGGTELAGVTTTDKDGNYKFENLSNGQYVLNFVFNYGENKGTYTYDAQDSAVQFTNSNPFVVSGSDVTWPQAIKQVNIEIDPEDPDKPIVTPEPTPDLPKPTVVDGKVLWYDGDEDDSNNDPVEGAKVYIYTAGGEYTSLGSTITDKDGHWSVEGLPVGNFIAVFSYQGKQSRVLQFEITEEDFNRGTLTVGTQYFDRDGSDTTATIKGVVLDENGNPTKTLVQLFNNDGELIDFQYTDGRGRYEFIVPAGYTYQVKAMDVNMTTETITVGNPDEEHTSLNKYILSGNVTDKDGNPVDGATVVVYREGPDGEFVDIETATLTNANGDYSVELTNSGNYRVVVYKDGEKYLDKKTSIGYKDYEPTVSESEIPDKYIIKGDEEYDNLKLIDHTTGVVKVIEEIINGKGYEFEVPAGIYEIVITKDGVTKTYYMNVPETDFDKTYRVDIEGDILDENGNPVLGAIVTLKDADGNTIGLPQTIIDGHYKFEDLPKGEYTVEVEYPVTGTVIFDKKTTETDSNGNKYPDGMTSGSSWCWNVNSLIIGGTVTDQNGNPIKVPEGGDITVIIQDKNDPDNVYTAIPKADGTWTAGVPEGNYEVKAVVTVDESHQYISNEIYNVTVGNGEPVDDIDFTVTIDKLTGIVIRDGDDDPIPGAEVIIKYPDGTIVPVENPIITNEEGKFEVPLFPDDYEVIVVVGDGDNKIESKPIDVTVNGDTEITIPVDAPIIIQGTVYNPDGTVASGAVVHYSSDGIDSNVVTNKDGKYQIFIYKDDLNKEYTIQAHAYGLSSDETKVTVNTNTIVDLTLEESSDKNADKVISGVVTDNEGKRVPGALVAITYGNDKNKHFVTGTDENGEYHFNVPDGTYYLTAEYVDGEQVYVTNSETEVEVVGKDVTQNLVLTVAYATTIKVIDTEGKLVEGATVTYRGQTKGEGITGNNGSVVLNIPAGNYIFKAKAGNRESNDVMYTVSKKGELTLVVDAKYLREDQPIATPTDYTIDGYVFDPNGKVVEGADVDLYKFNDVTEKWEKIDDTKSDSQGYYKFTGLEDGKYKVDIHYNQSHNVSDEDLIKHNMYIDGYATDDNGNPYVGATVILIDADTGKELQSQLSGSDGYYRFDNLDEGNYTVKIIPANDEGGNTTIIEDIKPDYDSVEISGVVTDVNGRPVEGAVVVVTGENGDKYTQITGEDGAYDFTLPDDTYTVTITYPDSTEINTNDYSKPDEPDAPTLWDDSYTVSGIVCDTDDKPVEGATVILKDKDGNQIDSQVTGADGKYEFTDLDHGYYEVEVIWKNDQNNYDVDATGDRNKPTDPDYKQKIFVAGKVITNHGKLLSNADVLVNTLPSPGVDTVTVMAARTGDNGKFKTDFFDVGTYTVKGQYRNSMNEINYAEGEVPITGKTLDDIVLVIILKYTANVGGIDVPVYAGEDDEFNTPDDYYPWDLDGDGEPDVNVYVGEDGKPGTPDDWYHWDSDGDDEPDTPVYIGKDCIPGTEDDWYPADIDKDGEPETPVYVGPDGKPGTEDDWYLWDLDGDGEPETPIHVGPDGKPGTEDDWYEFDDDDDPETPPVIVIVGPDGIPGTEDDEYEKPDDNGDKKHPFAEVTFNANGGSVNGTTFIKMLVKDIKSLPIATRSGYTFQGWYTDGGKLVANISYFDSLTSSVTLTARWQFDGSGGDINPPKPSDNKYTITFDDGDGNTVVREFKKDTLVNAPDFKKDGYHIDHWVDENGNTVDLSKPLNKDMTLTAVWAEGSPTDSEWYPWDTNKDGDLDDPDDRVNIGNDKDKGTPDDWYVWDTNKDGDTDDQNDIVYIGPDGVPGTEDDWYKYDTNGDGDTNDIEDTIYVGEDGIPGTSDDYYLHDTNGDGDLDDPCDKIYIGDDAIPGTEDDWYPWDTNKDGDLDDPNDKVYVGDDKIPGTPDDWYPWDTNKDGDTDDPTDKVYIGNDSIPGTEDDWYPHDTNGDGDLDDPNDKVYIGPDGIPGTEDDWFIKDVDGDGIPDIIIVGPDGLPGTEDDIIINGKTQITVTTHDGYGNTETYKVPVGTKVEEITVPLRSGYKFSCWVDEEGNEVPNTRIMITDTDLTATWTYAGTSAWLDTDDHFAYISGYPNGTVGPNNDITRAEVAQIFYRLLRPEIRKMYEKQVSPFTDVPADAWYSKAVATLNNMGVVSGVGNNKFAPNKKITRAEFATIAARMDKLDPAENIFTDVKPTDWFYKYVTSAYNHGWVSGVGHNLFQPNRNITRAETMTIVNNVLHRKPTKASVLSFKGSMKEWPDNMNTDAWYYVAVQEATNGHLHRIWNGQEIWIKLESIFGNNKN